MDTTWHNGDRLNNAAKAFHDKYARQPSRLVEARQMNAPYIKEIEDYLRSKDLCSRIVYSGSAYEGTKVSKSPDNDDLEFDVMIIMVRYVFCRNLKRIEWLNFWYSWCSNVELAFCMESTKSWCHGYASELHIRSLLSVEHTVSNNVHVSGIEYFCNGHGTGSVVTHCCWCNEKKALSCYLLAWPRFSTLFFKFLYPSLWTR